MDQVGEWGQVFFGVMYLGFGIVSVRFRISVSIGGRVRVSFGVHLGLRLGLGFLLGPGT